MSVEFTPIHLIQKIEAYEKAPDPVTREGILSDLKYEAELDEGKKRLLASSYVNTFPNGSLLCRFATPDADDLRLSDQTTEYSLYS